MNRKDIEGYQLASNIEGSDFSVKIFVKRPQEVMERIANLPDTAEGYELTPKELAATMFTKECSEIYSMLHTQAAELDPKTWERADYTKADFKKAFEDAGFDTIFMEEVSNEYWCGIDKAWALSRPWFMVTTPVGHIKVGWRKRVIELNWERTTIEATAEKLFPDHSATTGHRMVHAYGYERLTAYLKTLRDLK